MSAARFGAVLMRNDSPGCRCLRGQASIEYTVVVMLVVVVLISYTDESGVVHSAIGDVVKALKDLFGAYSWAISFSNNLTPL